MLKKTSGCTPSRAVLSRVVPACGTFLLAAFAASAVHAAYPDKPIRMIVGFAPGTGPDVAARVVAQKLQEAWGSSVVVENKDGAAGALAAQEVARANPDGYTLFFGAVAQLSVAPSTYKKLPYDPQKDFEPISEVVASDFVFVAPPGTSARNMKDYASWARAQNPLFLATFGAGTLGHFGSAVFASEYKVSYEPVHYKRTGDAVIGVLNGDVQGLFGSTALAVPYVKSGKLRGLATTGSARSPLLPDVPTFRELGHPELEFTAWFGVLAPAKTPSVILDQLNGGIVKAVQAPASRTTLENAGFRVTGTTRDEFSALIKRDTARWAKIVKSTGFQALD